MLSNLKSNISRNLTNLRGWKTNRKIVVFESDDWGSIRMPCKKVKEDYEKLGYDLSKNPYCQFDTLANSEDLLSLFDLLSKFEDFKRNNPIITFNTVIGNPKFDFIKRNNFEHYEYEIFTETLERYYPNENIFQLWKEGIKSNLIKPQFHGREHVNVPLWLKELKDNNKPLIDAFNLGFWGIPNSLYSSNKLNIQASYDSYKETDVEFYRKSVENGLNLFEDLFKYKSKSFIANNYVWNERLNFILKRNGIDFLQGMKYQKLPLSNYNNARKKKKVYTGLKNENGQIHFVRNCVFEPAHYSNIDNVGNCLNHIQEAFLFKKPAIITMHRLNLIGSISLNNRSENHKQLESLLNSIIKKWPDVEFMTSDSLGLLIKNSN